MKLPLCFLLIDRILDIWLKIYRDIFYVLLFGKLQTDKINFSVIKQLMKHSTIVIRVRFIKSSLKTFYDHW